MEILKVYRDGGTFNVIAQYHPSERIYNLYSYDFSRNIFNCRAGAFQTVEEATEMMMRHRPKAFEDIFYIIHSAPYSPPSENGK